MRRKNLMIYMGSAIMVMVIALTACMFSFRDKKQESARNNENKQDKIERVTDSRKAEKKQTNSVDKKQDDLSVSEAEDNTTEVEKDEEDAAAVNVTQYNFHGGSILEWPVNGNIVINFDMEHMVYFSTMDEYRYSDAIAISSEEDTDVKAAAAGEVTKIWETKEHGLMVSMRIGPEYEITYGQLKNCNLKVGDHVNRGDYFAKVSKVTSYYTKEGDHLYLALTRDGEHENPLSYLDFSE